MPGTGGTFGKTKTWIATILKNLIKLSNSGKKSGLFVWHDELGLQRSGMFYFKLLVKEFNVYYSQKIFTSHLISIIRLIVTRKE